jgi:hypothetical protein
MNTIVEFREFFVPAGASANFLASRCLWDSVSDAEWAQTNSSTNEFYVERCKLVDKQTNTTSAWLNKAYVDSAAAWLDMDDSSKAIAHLKSESKRILPILLELKNIVKSGEFSPKHLLQDKMEFNLDGMNEIITIIETNDFRRLRYFFEVGCYFWDFSYPRSEHVDRLIIEAQDYFASCREYYFKECERRGIDSYLITHQHPHVAISSRLKLPKNYKSLAMTFDEETHMITSILWDIKNHPASWNSSKMKKYSYDDSLHYDSTDLSIKRVSYRKIFFENDSDEIRKMYDFFHNEDYFDENKTNILQEFQKYHNDNMAVLKQYVPDLYEEIT